MASKTKKMTEPAVEPDNFNPEFDDREWKSGKEHFMNHAAARGFSAEQARFLYEVVMGNGEE